MTTLTNKLKESFYCLILEFLLSGLWFLRGAMSPQMETLHLSAYVYLYTKVYALNYFI